MWALSRSLLIGIPVFLFGCVGTVAIGAGHAPLRHGGWGGDHIKMSLQADGADLEFDCGYGRIAAAVHPDGEGRFSVGGFYTSESGGPARTGDPAAPRQDALYRGWTDGEVMRIEVVLKKSGKEVGTFTLRYGGRANLDKCL